MSGENNISNRFRTEQPELGLDWGPGPDDKVDLRTDLEREDADLEKGLYQIWDIAEKYHLDPYPTHFEVASADTINQIAGYGVPGRFSHWTFGREFDKMRTQYNYGLSKIYELVVNSNPAQAFLLENNPPIENKFIMAHVLGHTDFFKNNFRFESTRDDMLEVIAANAKRLGEYEDKHGRLEVESFLDAVLALDDHVDPYTPNRPSGPEELKQWEEDARRKIDKGDEVEYYGEFDDVIVHPEVTVGPKRIFRKTDVHIPPKPEADILGFVRNHAPYLEDWQRDAIDIARAESIYFYPQRRTKIMNEGWAAYWHKRIMREMSNRDQITNADNEKWWKLHSGVVSEGGRSLNPYHLGMKMYEYLEDYYNGNLTEKETRRLERDGTTTYPHFDGPLEDSPASSKLRDVMKLNDDQSLIRNYFDKNFAERMNFYIYEEHIGYDGRPIRIVKETGWKDIRDKLLRNLDNSGTPYIEVIDGDYNLSKQLYLKHGFDGRPLDPEYVNKTLPKLFKMWQRPVHLQTVREVSGKQINVVYTYDGSKITSANRDM